MVFLTKLPSKLSSNGLIGGWTVKSMRQNVIDAVQEQLRVGDYNYLNFATKAGGLNTARHKLHYNFKTEENSPVAENCNGSRYSGLLNFSGPFKGI